VETQVIKLAAQTIDAFLPGEPDGTDGEAQLLCYLRIRARRRLEEKQFD
jgi:hypothetical protein